MARVLFLSCIPLKGQRGGPQLSRALAQALIDVLGERLLVSSGVHPLPPLPGLATERGLTLAAAAPLARLAGTLTGSAGDAHYPVLDRALPELVDGVDAVLLNGTVFGRLALPLKALGRRVIAIHHNQERDYYRDAYAWPLRLAAMRIADRNQAIAWRHADVNVTLTAFDADALAARFGAAQAKAIVLPAFLPADREMPAPARRGGPHGPLRVGVSGNLGARQTRAGVLGFLREVVMPLQRAGMRIEIVVAGSAPDRGMRRAVAAVGGELLADPSRIEAAYDRCHLGVVPVPGGSGMKLRLMDPLSVGLPVLAHAAAARGYEALPPEMLMTYQTAAQAREALRSVALDRSPQAATIQAWFNAGFGFEAGRARIAALLDQLSVTAPGD